jgi:hypothetical protein
MADKPGVPVFEVHGDGPWKVVRFLGAKGLGGPVVVEEPDWHALSVDADVVAEIRRHPHGQRP